VTPSGGEFVSNSEWRDTLYAHSSNEWDSRRLGAVDIAGTPDDHIQQETSRIAGKPSLYFRHAAGEEIAKWRKGQAEPKHAG
jgi:hypothetical protein